MPCLSPVIFLVLLTGATDGDPPSPPGIAEAKAVAFLIAEVPRWSRENRCYSCHNNGDAARALYEAARAGYRVPKDTLASTNRWLGQPAAWEHNGGDGPFSDKRLARVVFTATLDTAVATKRGRDRSVLITAAERLLLDQAPDGSWPVDEQDAAGSPAAYGRPLATFMARQCLFSADPRRFQAAIGRADAWLAGQNVLTVTDASVFLMACAAAKLPASSARLQRSLDLLRRVQSSDGGWDLARLAPEPFDTALAILALTKWQQSPELRGMIGRGRAFLVAQQQEDGSWIETTRPAGNVSYAQRISTAGWATCALLATRELSARDGADSKR